MTDQQADDLLSDLIFYLEIYGFSEVVSEIFDNLNESLQQEKFPRNQEEILLFFLSESIEIMKSFSSKNYERLMSTFKEYVEGDVKRVLVEINNRKEISYFDLEEIPDYSKISSLFEEIYSEILSDRSREDDTN